MARKTAYVSDLSNKTIVARVGLIVGGLVCLVLTPSLALAYFSAYGSSGESPPDWLAELDLPTRFAGADAVATYNRYGVLFGLALAVVVGSLAVVVVHSRKGKGGWERGAWWLIVGGLAAVAAGSLAEYGIDLDIGFGFELLGFLFIGIGTVVLGWAVHREAGVGGLKSIGIAAVGLVGFIVGTASVGHFPSGPASLLLITAIVIGVTGLPDSTRT